MNRKTKALFNSGVALLLCISMLLGTTWAWFIDSVVSTANVISTGTLKVGLYHTNSAGANDTKVTNETKNLFKVDLWEPGVAAYENFTVKNEGSLWLKYQLGLNALDQNYVQRGGSQFGLSQALVAGVVPGGILDSNNDGTITREEAVGQITQWKKLNEVLENGFLAPKDKADTVTGVPVTDTTDYGVVIWWQPSAGDNNWNVNNGANTSDGNPLTVDLGVTLSATQYSREEDSFGPDYDGTAEFPELDLPVKVTVTVPSENGLTTQDVTMQGRDVKATVPAGVQLADGEQTLTLTVTEMEQSSANVSIDTTEEMVSLDVHIAGVAEGNTTPIIVDLGPVMPKYLNMGNYHLYHVEGGSTNPMTLVGSVAEVDAHNEFYYDANTGSLTVAMATFSEVAVVADTVNAWEGNFDYSWYTNAVASADAEAVTEYKIANADQLAGFGAIVGGMAEGIEADSFVNKTVNLIADVNLGDDEENNNEEIIFYPIGYYNSERTYEKTKNEITSGFYTFEGTFNGQGHTISNFYQNTWEMKGDHDWYKPEEQYYRDGMGLFGRVYGGTVKNLTVDNFSSDGEIATTGVIAAYADGATFENIAITNCNPRVYNIGNGGIVGCVGWYAEEAGLTTTFTNITVDNSNKISALWGSYDVACGGIVGQYYPTSGQTGSPKNAGIDLVNCHVSAQMDVYNDVCGNYQYYAYRYAGMMIGSIRENETIDGHVYPKMDGIAASGCTVHFDTWNDYFYCELKANSIASYTHDHQFSRLTEVKSISGTAITYLDGTTGTVPATGRHNYVVVNGEFATENATCYHFVDGEVWNHKTAGTEMVNGKEELVEDKQHIYLPFDQLFTGYGWGVTSKGLTDYEGVETMDITHRDNTDLIKKFEKNEALDGSFLYRVGNGNAFPVGKLFQWTGNDKVANSGVHVSVKSLIEGVNLNGAFVKNESDWTQSTLHITGGTGPAELTIQDYNNCEPFTITVEVVDAVNATSATSATKNNVVLLNDCGFSSLTVSDGYTLFGNGFTMTCGSDSEVLDFGYAFVTLDSGILDNVQIVCPNFDYAALYKMNLTSNKNRSSTDANGTTRYYNAKSGVMASGNSQILNSRISGARAAVNVTSGNMVIDNSRIELGAVASVLVGVANSLTLRDVTLVQKPAASTYDSSKTLMGFSVLLVCNSDGDAAPVTLEGKLVQNAWVDENDKQYVPSEGQSIISDVLTKTEYLHDLDGDETNESLNLGFAYMPASAGGAVNATTITDNRTNKDTVPYDYAEVSILNGKTYVYSYKNTNGTGDSFKTESEYQPNEQSDIITVSYSDTADGLTTGKSFDTAGWVYELNVDLDKIPGYAVDFNELSMSVNGVAVTDFKVNGNAKPTSPVAVTAGGKTYELTATINGKEYTATFKVTGTETTKESPSLVASNYEAALLVGEAGSTFSKDTWHGAAPALNGIQIKYWSVAEKQYKTITLSDYTPTTAGKQNGTNNTWTYSPANGDFTLTLTGGQVHQNNGVNAMPVVCNGKLYFVSAGSNGLVNYGNSARTIPVTYSFKDNNGGTELTFSHTWSVECANGNTAYDYSDFCNGTSKTFTIKSSNGNSCVAPDTLVSMGDGSKKEIQYVSVGEEVVAWNFETGSYEVVPAALCQIDSEGMLDVLYLNFEDGTTLKVLGEHGIFDADLNNFIFIDIGDVDDYLGHRFVKRDGDSFKTVKLVDYQITTEDTKAYTILAAGHHNVVLEDMFTLTPAHVGDNFFNPYTISEGLKYDAGYMKADIEKHGLYTYEDFAHVLTREQFAALNLAPFKVSVGKGLVTYEGLIYLIQNFVNR